MPKRRPKGEIDEDVIQLGAGSISLEQYEKPIHRVKKKNPIGFVWPDEKKPKRPKKRRT